MDMLQQFGLNDQQARLLFSMQRYLVKNDINVEKIPVLKKKKAEWLDTWEKGILKLLNQSEDDNKVNLIKNEGDLKRESQFIVNECKHLKTPLFLILLEASLFAPYFPVEGFQKSFYEITVMDEKKAIYVLRKFSDMLKINGKIVERYKKSFKGSIRSVSGFYTKMLIGTSLGAVLLALTAGLATPVIAALAAPAGLSGAAAVSAGLAALGGGAVAAGGLGMAGGMCVIVGGGTIFGALSGASLGAALGGSADYALREGAKLQVMMKEIILYAQKDICLAQKMIQSQREVIKQLESDLSELRFNEKENKDGIKNLGKAIEYLRSSLENSEKELEKSYIYKDDGEYDKKRSHGF
ncbi:hypothetical protein [Priestia megaterium]|uniref:hypothetical protein n=1 Tax=Priestia megaterium TaxID=1404 RepID=UPI0015D474CF|nr:hypothetical protein [Priestia megaterium]